MIRRTIVAGAVAALLAQPALAQQAPLYSLQYLDPTAAAAVTASAKANTASALAGARATARVPSVADDVSTGRAVGAFWMQNSRLFQLQDNTAAAAVWTDATSPMLPLDAVGFHVKAAATITSGGSGYVAGDVGKLLTFANGMVFTISAVTSGAVTAGTFTGLQGYGCAPAAGAALTPTISTATGTGATITPAYLMPVGHSTHLLSKCWAGNALVVRNEQTNLTTTVGFLPNGMLDEATLAQASGALYQGSTDAGQSLRVTTEYAQSIQAGASGPDLVQTTAAQQPTIFFGRRLGNSLSVMYDEHTGTTNWQPANTNMTATFAGFSVADASLALVFGQAAQNAYDIYNLLGFNPQMGFGLNSNGAKQFTFYDGPIVSTNDEPHDDANVAVGVNTNGAATSAFFNGFNYSHTGATNGSTNTVLNVGGDGSGNGGQNDQAVDMEIPFSLTAAQQAALEASLYTAFDIRPQGQSMIAIFGDSHSDGYGATYDQSWPRQMLQQLNRPDVHLYNFSAAGAPISYGTNFLSSFMLPFAKFSGTKLAFIMSDYNDPSAAAAISGIQTIAAAVHSNGGKVICGVDVYRNTGGAAGQSGGSQVGSAQAQVASVSATLLAQPTYCDGIVNFQAYAPFNQPNGPFVAPLFESQDFGIHLTTYGQGHMARMAAPFIGSLLP